MDVEYLRSLGEADEPAVVVDTLEQLLPSSLPLLNCLHLAMCASLSSEGAGKQFYVNSGWSKERLVLVCVDGSEAEVEKWLLYSQGVQLNMLETLLETWVSKRTVSKHLLLGGLLPQHAGILKKLLGRQVAWEAACNVYWLTREPFPDGETFPLETGFCELAAGWRGLEAGWKVEKLGVEHVELILSCWKFGDRTDSQRAMLTDLALQDRLFGLLPPASTGPVVWVALYSYGSMGLLHTREGWRRRGLATILMELVAEWVRREWGVRAYVHIEEGNSASQRLFSRMGFKKGDEAIWTGC